MLERAWPRDPTLPRTRNGGAEHHRLPFPSPALTAHASMIAFALRRPSLSPRGAFWYRPSSVENTRSSSRGIGAAAAALVVLAATAGCGALNRFEDGGATVFVFATHHATPVGMAVPSLGME